MEPNFPLIHTKWSIMTKVFVCTALMIMGRSFLNTIQGANGTWSGFAILHTNKLCFEGIQAEQILPKLKAEMTSYIPLETVAIFF